MPTPARLPSLPDASDNFLETRAWASVHGAEELKEDEMPMIHLHICKICKSSYKGNLRKRCKGAFPVMEIVPLQGLKGEMGDGFSALITSA